MLKTLAFFYYLEFISRLRHSQEWLYPLCFFVIVVSLFPLALSTDPQFLRKAVPGCLWIAALFSSVLSMESLFTVDLEDGFLEQQLLSHYPFYGLIYIKLSVQWMMSELPLILLTPVLGLLFHLSLSSIMSLCISLLLGTPMLTCLGAFGVALTLSLRQQGLLLSLLILPLSIPILIFGVAAVTQAENGLSSAGPLAFLAGLLILTLMSLPFATAASLKVGMDA